ncbi:PilZ domain-containing protein [Roseibium algae]|uniref:PilZ domain-containing protein n=1 Tax=Roseibium algae TaxID=3123038 RepID=A0ABU8TK36_9HYPH
MAAAPNLKLFEDLRLFPRKNCRWPAVMKAPDRHYSCVLEDISAGGCRIALNTSGIPVGIVITLVVPSKKLNFHGEIRWVRFGEAGIEFHFMD